MFCHACGQSIEDGSNFCRHCGAKQAAEPTSAPGVTSAPAVSEARSSKGPPKVVLGGLAVLALIVIGVASNKPSSTSGSQSEVASNTAAAIEAQADMLENAADQAAAGGDTATAEVWSYRSDEDKIRGSTTYFATTTSTNTVHQDSPYDSATTMSMALRKSRAYGTDVILTISSGQMMCPSYEGCSGTVRFDNGPAQRVSFAGPADNSSETIFVEGAKSFIAKVKRAKRVVIEKTLYQAGNPQFEFDVHGLKWEH